jgi:CDP-diacylglycerol--serine O-phosphatidyltransferase
MRRVVFVAPSAFTLGNLFFGVWSIVSSARGALIWAGWFIVFAALLDGLDGRLARFSRASSRFGAELDSLVDLVSFGLAPALLMYHLELAAAGRFAWVVCYLYVVATALRLARFNVMIGSTPMGWFTGLPSPAAGTTLAVYYPFTQTELSHRLAPVLDLQHQGVVVLMVLLSVLMVSTVKYPKSPRISIRSARGVVGALFYAAVLLAVVLEPGTVLFPMALAYVAYGVLRFAFLSLLDRPVALASGDGGPGAREAAAGGDREGRGEEPRREERRR